MNEFLRRVLSLATAGILVVLLAVTAAVAVAVADSGDGGEGTSGSGDSEDRDGGDSDKKTTTEKKDSSGDRGKSEDKRRDGTGTLPNPGKPKQGETFNVRPRKGKGKGKGHGKIRVKLPGAAKTVPLEQSSSVPVGSVVDATQGQVTLTTVPRADGMVQSATFSGAAFKVTQSKTGKPVTDVRLRGGSFAGCTRPFARRSVAGRMFGAFASRSKKRKVRSLWGSGHGNFRTHGRGGAATVRGTIWLTEDRCDGTLVKVRRGVVGVRDFAKKKTFTVRAGHSHFARLRSSR
jgi:hypothetical protein